MSAIRRFSNVNLRRTSMALRYLLAGTLAAAAFAFATPAATPALAQGFEVDAPGVHVGVGNRDRYRYSDRYRERRYYMREDRGRGCRTVTIERDDGSMKRIRRCD